MPGSPLARALVGCAAVFLFYVLGVGVRQLFGSCVDIRNKSNDTVRSVSVRVEGGSKHYSVPDLAPGDHRRVYVQTSQKSAVILTIADGRNRLRDITVFGEAQPRDCGVSIVTIEPGSGTESDESHAAVCWMSWLDFM